MSLLAWLRRRLSWSTDTQSRHEWLGIGALVLVAITLGWLGSGLSAWRQLLLWALLVLALALVARRGWLKLFGPVFFFDLIRNARRQRGFFARALYGGSLLVLVSWTYIMWINHHNDAVVRADEMADFAASFFYVFMIVQFVWGVILTPGAVAGAIAEEKDRRTLEFILATDLRDREIVFGKLAARFANTTLLLMTGIPILSLLQFLGGVDPGMMLAGFAVTGLTLASLASLSIFNSVMAKRPRDAIALTYLVYAGYLLLSGLSWFLTMPQIGWSTTALGIVMQCVETFNSGNVISALYRVMNALFAGGRADEVFPVVLRDYAIFHGLVTVGFLVWAVVRLRPVALRQMFGTAARLSWRDRAWPRPAVSSQPMYWKEIHTEPPLRMNWMGRIFMLLLVLGSFVPVGIIAYYSLNNGRLNNPTTWYKLGEYCNVWVRFAGTIVAMLTLVGVAVRASGSVSGERDRQTFDTLLTSPLGSRSMLLAKWLGNILSVRKGWLWLASIWAIGLATGGLHPIAIPLMAVSWFVYAAVFSGVGLWFSTTTRTTLRSTVWTLFVVMMLTLGHWVVMFILVYLPLSFSPSRDHEFAEWIMKIEAGQTPPVVLAYAAVWSESLEELERESWSERHSSWHYIASCAAGVVTWAGLAVAMWFLTHWRFRKLTGRTAVRVPDGLAPPGFAAKRPRSLRRRTNLPAALPAKPSDSPSSV